jgi:predicted acetyltransferase
MGSSSSDAYPIRPVSADEFDSFEAVDQHAFHGSPLSDAVRRLITSRFEYERSLAAFDGGQPVGTAGAYSFQLSVPGGDALPAAGVTFVSVLPTHRRRGVLTSIMRRQLRDIRELGEPLAVLWASEAAIYSRFGYGLASWQLSFTVRRGEGALAAFAPDTRDVRLRLVEPSAALPEMAKIYQAVMPSRPGFFARHDAWWQRLLHDPAEERHGAGPLRCVLAEAGGEPQGYVLYSGNPNWGSDGLPDGTVTVRELMSASPAAGAALWADLLSRDLATEFRAYRRPLDDPLLYQLADPRRVRSQVTDSLWVRIVDVPAALSGRSYSCPVDTVIEVRDELLPANAGSWRLAAPGSGSGAASCVPATSATSGPDIALDVTALGAAYLGGISLGALAQAGLVTELRPGAVRRLSAAMSWDIAPWCPTVFLWEPGYATSRIPRSGEKNTHQPAAQLPANAIHIVARTPKAAPNAPPSRPPSGMVPQTTHRTAAFIRPRSCGGQIACL